MIKGKLESGFHIIGKRGSHKTRQLKLTEEEKILHAKGTALIKKHEAGEVLPKCSRCGCVVPEDSEYKTCDKCRERDRQRRQAPGRCSRCGRRLTGIKDHNGNFVSKVCPKCLN